METRLGARLVLDPDQACVSALVRGDQEGLPLPKIWADLKVENAIGFG